MILVGCGKLYFLGQDGRMYLYIGVVTQVIGDVTDASGGLWEGPMWLTRVIRGTMS